MTTSYLRVTASGLPAPVRRQTGTVRSRAPPVERPRVEASAAAVADFLEHREQFVVRRESGQLYP